MIQLASLFAVLSLAQAGATSSSAGDYIYTPSSSVRQSENAGLRAHTNFLIHVFSSMGSFRQIETPSSLRSVYDLPSTGGSGVIAIVDAYNYPTALADFNTFSKEFGLPTESSTNSTSTTNKVFEVVYSGGKQPSTDSGWALEEALDIEWAHAMAPSAKIILVEAPSDSFSDLFGAVDTASKLVAAAGKGEVSMSWGSDEFSGEQAYDSHFQTAGVVYFAASGDTGGVAEYPSTSPYVVGAGGTTISRTPNGTFMGETGWSDSGGGLSRYESIPSYQDTIQSRVNTSRGAPDLSFDADPNSGVYVYDSTPYERSSGWWVVGGTSLASPALAGVVNLANHFYTSAFAELGKVYGNLGTSDFRDIVMGRAGMNFCEVGWDAVTGVGSPLGLTGK
jgi:subtilase family serine protease